LTVKEAAQSRRSIRKYLQEPVPDEDIRAMLDQVRLAPSPNNTQPWRFVVIRDPELKKRLEPAALNQRQVLSAHCLILLYVDMENVLETFEETVSPGMQGPAREKALRYGEREWGSESVEERGRFAHGIGYIALGYLLLAAEAMGYQTSPMLGFKPAAFREILGLPEHVTMPALVAIGRGDEPGFPHHRHSVDRIASFR
jgi:nitroreductase